MSSCSNALLISNLSWRCSAFDVCNEMPLHTGEYEPAASSRQGIVMNCREARSSFQSFVSSVIKPSDGLVQASFCIPSIAAMGLPIQIALVAKVVVDAMVPVPKPTDSFGAADFRGDRNGTQILCKRFVCCRLLRQRKWRTR
jgi:hypothetical protein